jgi:hypothetical protein
MTRTFESGPAKREATPVMIAIVAPSGAGKTKSAFRIADGFSLVTPGPTVVIDTEAKRALHYAGEHKFIHLDFSPPHGPLDYIEAGKAAMRHNPTTIIIDQCSYEWEGMGGVTEMHDDELDRMAGNDYKKRERCTMTAWIRPKKEHNKFKQFMIQQRVNWILLFRAKEKIKPQKGGEPLDLGWQPIGGEDLFYECILRCLLLPGSDGKPTWHSDKMSELEIMRLPAWFRDIFAKPRQLDEGIGEQIARWAMGGDIGAPSTTETASRTTSEPAGQSSSGLAARFDACTTRVAFVALDAEMNADWKRLPKEEKPAITEAFKRASARIKALEAAKPATTDADWQAEALAQEAKENR